MSSEAQTNKRKVFPFFKLPRELRDIIYEACEHEVQTHNIKANQVAHGAEHHVRIDNLLCINLLQVSKQFANEYKQMWHPNPEMVVYEGCGVRTSRRTTRLPGSTHNICDITFRLFANRNNLEDDLDVSGLFVEDYFRCHPTLIPARTNLEIFVFSKLPHGRRATFAELDTYNYSLGPLCDITLLGMASIKVYAVMDQSHEYKGLMDLGVSADLIITDLASWTTADGWQEEDEDQCSWKL